MGPPVKQIKCVTLLFFSASRGKSLLLTAAAVALESVVTQRCAHQPQATSHPTHKKAIKCRQLTESRAVQESFAPACECECENYISHNALRDYVVSDQHVLPPALPLWLSVAQAVDRSASHQDARWNNMWINAQRTFTAN
ncbi:hypothetical protein WMY93_003136 [Mugilogobius chulae]|uniref:Secreted protein n=1 Tax=Mugilogobius chulae TaxID=88201 RepID=A0AAW0PXE7_9GOBI